LAIYGSDFTYDYQDKKTLGTSEGWSYDWSRDKECIENFHGITSWEISASNIDMGMGTNFKTFRWMGMETNTALGLWGTGSKNGGRCNS
jgi:hypothetical protein